MNERKPTAPYQPLDVEIQRLIEFVATEFGNRYVDEFLIPNLAKPLSLPAKDRSSLLIALDDPIGSLRALYGHYAFARRGKFRNELATAAQVALGHICQKKGLQSPSDDIWFAFTAACEASKIKCNELQDRGIVQGLFELAAEVESASSGQSIVRWIAQQIHAQHKAEEVFTRIVDIRGLGPKTTSTLMRDIVHLHDLEDQLEAAEKIHIQPVDKWLRLMAAEAVPEQGMDRAADWVIAGKVTKYCRRAGASSILFSMGSTYFGQRIVREANHFHAETSRLKRSLQGASPR